MLKGFVKPFLPQGPLKCMPFIPPEAESLTCHVILKKQSNQAFDQTYTDLHLVWAG